MTRLEAHFFKRSQQERDKKTIRAANSILKPRKIRACKTRISEREPRKGTETPSLTASLIARSMTISEREPRKGTETLTVLPCSFSLIKFQNVNPERGRKPPMETQKTLCGRISEREPRKGTETSVPMVAAMESTISEREPRKGTETCSRPVVDNLACSVSEREPRKGTETRAQPRRPSSCRQHFRT